MRLTAPMNKTDFLFTKISSMDTGIGHVVVGIGDDIENNTKNISPATNDKSTPLISKKGEKDERKNWFQDNRMFLVTLSGVIMGILIGELNNKISSETFIEYSKINKQFNPIESHLCAQMILHTKLRQ